MSRKLILVAVCVAVLATAALVFVISRQPGALPTAAVPVANEPATLITRTPVADAGHVVPPVVLPVVLPVAVKPVAAPAAPSVVTPAAPSASAAPALNGGQISREADLERLAAALSKEQAKQFLQAAHERELEHAAAEYRYKLPSENLVRLIDYYAQQKDLALTADQLAKLDAFTQSLRPQMEAAGIINQIDQFRDLNTKAIQALNAHADNAGELYTQAQKIGDQAEQAKGPFNTQFLNYATTILTPTQNQALDKLLGQGVKPSAG